MNSSQSPLAWEVNQLAHYQESQSNFSEGISQLSGVDCKNKPSF